MNQEQAAEYTARILKLIADLGELPPHTMILLGVVSVRDDEVVVLSTLPPTAEPALLLWTVGSSIASAEPELARRWMLEAHARARAAAAAAAQDPS